MPHPFRVLRPGQPRLLHAVLVLVLSVLFSARMVAQSCTVNISTNPSSVTAGQPVTVNATVTTPGSRGGGDPLDATLNYDGSSICSFSSSDSGGCSVSIDPGAAGTHLFDWTCIDGFTGDSNSGSQSLQVNPGSGGPAPAPGVTQGFLLQYLVVSLLYPPPGNSSSISFADTPSNSVTAAISQMFPAGTSLTFVATADTPNGAGSPILGQPNIAITPSASNPAAFIATVSGSEVSTAASHQDFVDHYQDVFFIWLNPLILVTQTGPNSATYTVTTPLGTDGNREPVDVIPVSVTDLLNPAQIPPAMLQPIAIGSGGTVPGLSNICANPASCTPADFTAILQQDPLLFPFGESNPNTSPVAANPDSTKPRFVPITTSNLLLLDPSVQNTFTATDSGTASNPGFSIPESVGFELATAAGVIQTTVTPGFTLPLTSTQTFPLTETAGLDGSTHEEQATMATTNQGCFEAIDVFEDTLFHSFVLVPPGASPAACGSPGETFQLTVLPPVLAVNAGSSGSYTVVVTGEFGYADPVSLSVTGLPSGAIGVFVPSTIQGGTGSARLVVATSLSTPPGDSTLTITATGDAITQRATAVLRVSNFSLSAIPGTQTVSPGQTAAFPIKVTPLDEFDSNVQLSVTGAPSGVVCNFSANPVTGASLAFGSQISTLNCTVPTGTALGSSILTVTGSSGNISHSTTVVLNVIALSVSASPGSQTVIAGGSTSYAVTVAGTSGFTGLVNLSLSASCPGITGSFSPASVSGSGSSTLSITTANSTPAGNCTLTITGTSGSVVGSIPVDLSVQNFILSVNPASQSVSPGQSATFTATVTFQNGFTGNVALSVTGLPAGATATFNPSSLSASGSSVLTISTTASSPTGAFTIIATSGGLSQSQQATFVVSSFNLAINTSSQTVSAGNSASYQVSLVPTGGFTGSVSLSASGLPSGATPVFSPTSISGSSTSALTVSTANSLAAGTYPFTITGTSGGASATLAATLIVTAPVGDFSLSASPSSQTINAGDSASFNVAVNALNGFTGNVSLDVSGLPFDASASFSPASINGSGSSLLIIMSGTSTGTFFVTITGTSGSLSHSQTVQLTINSPCGDGGGLGGRVVQPCLSD